jgi:elongation factor G
LKECENIGIIAHIDAGKPPLLNVFYFIPARRIKCGSVDDGTTVTDWMEQEREGGSPIVSAAITTE